jgi:hypothetical protein
MAGAAIRILHVFERFVRGRFGRGRRLHVLTSLPVM